MRICEKVYMDRDDLIKNGPITIVAFGDSVTHGAVGEGEIDYESVYWNRLRKKILEIRNYVPINVINAGIGGITAKDSVDRMQEQVLSHNPDLIIICFGLNDVNGPLESFLSALTSIFEKALASDAEVIYMTPNMLNTSVAEDTADCNLEYAKVTADMQNNGRFDKYINAAIELSENMGVKVCDCYSKWKEMSKTQNTTMLLANRINHPIREMHQIFADSLFEIIFK